MFIESRIKNIPNNVWRPPTLSELSQMIFNMGLTHLGSEVSIYSIANKGFF